MTQFDSPASLECRECGKHYPIEPLSICEECFGPLEPHYDLGSNLVRSKKPFNERTAASPV